MVEPHSVASVLGLRREVRSAPDLIRAVESGLPRLSLRRIVRRVFPAGDGARFLRQVIPEATYHRSGPLSRLYSERAERLARVVAFAEDVFGDDALAHEWLRTPHPELEGRAAIEYSISEVGAREVELLLNRILYGLPV